MKNKVIIFVILLIILSLFLFGCNDKFENPECQNDLDCKDMGAIGGQCINNHCQLNPEPTSPPALPEE